jgi:hypothetical protein
MTETTGALAAALAKVQAELPTLERDRTVTVQPKDTKKDPYSYSYVTLASLTEAVMPLLAKNGLAFSAFPALAADGKMSLRYHLLHESGERLTGEFPISGEGGIQMIGGRITYSRRYCLAAVVGIAADEDDETHLANEAAPRTAQRNTRPRQAPDAKPARQVARKSAPPLPGESDSDKVTDKQLGLIGTLMTKADITDRDQRLRWVGDLIGREVATSRDLTRTEASKVIDELQKEVEPDDNPGFASDDPRPDDYEQGGPA